MAPVFLNLSHVPFYGLVAGAAVITWMLVKALTALQSMQFLGVEEAINKADILFRVEIRP